MRAFAWDVRKEWAIRLLAIAKGLITDWALYRLPVKKCLVSVQVLGNPLARDRRHGFIRTVECTTPSFPSPNTNLEAFGTQLTC